MRILLGVPVLWKCCQADARRLLRVLLVRQRAVPAATAFGRLASRIPSIVGCPGLDPVTNGLYLIRWKGIPPARHLRSEDAGGI